MKHIKQLLIAAFMLFIAINVMSQKVSDGYNPFVPANLDDPLKLSVVNIVESSYHLYSIKGDTSYADTSNFVWYVENGTLGTYDVASDTWGSADTASAISNGSSLELLGDSANRSEIWVRWNDASGGLTGYVAVYERSSEDCIFEGQLTGYKHTILAPPEIWFLKGEREECSDQFYSVTAKLNELRENSFPYKLNYTYPGVDGQLVDADTIITADVLDEFNQLTWDLEGVNDIVLGEDEVYPIRLNEFRDKFGSVGKIAPMGPKQNQFDEITITIYHLPQTEGMNMD